MLRYKICQMPLSMATLLLKYVLARTRKLDNATSSSLLLVQHRRRVSFTNISPLTIKLYSNLVTGESRTDLVGRNLKILGSAIEDMKPFRDDTIILLVSNPVDILTYFAQKFSGLPKNQVFGSGTFLDSARLRGILAEKCGVAASSIDAYVLGEHGDSQMVSSNSRIDPCTY